MRRRDFTIGLLLTTAVQTLGAQGPTKRGRPSLLAGADELIKMRKASNTR
jgi:hypothetical protein